MIDSSEPNAFCVDHRDSKATNPCIPENPTTLTFPDIHSQRHHPYITSIGNVIKPIKFDMKQKQITFQMIPNPLHSIWACLHVKNTGHLIIELIIGIILFVL